LFIYKIKTKHNEIQNEDGVLKLYAVAGTQTVLLSFDIAKAKVDKKQFLGFSVTRADKQGKVTTLNGSKHFESLIKDSTITDTKLKYRSLVQTFFWKDYSADPGEKYTYTVEAMVGTPRKFDPAYSSSIKIETEKLNEGKHSVYFNYGVTGSQAYKQAFREQKD